MTNLSDRAEDYCFFDFETRALPDAGDNGDLRVAGTYRYAKNARPIILTYAIGDQPVQLLTFRHDFFDNPGGHLSDFMQLPRDLQDFYGRALAGEAWFVAWKTSFDRNIWNQAGWPQIWPRMAIDAMCQALASNLPPDLHSASTALNGPGKQADGKKLISLFSPPDGVQPGAYAEEWRRFQLYAVQDTEILRSIFLTTRQLPAVEWQEYWAGEAINDRGVAVDLAFCDKADRLVQAATTWSNNKMFQLTGIPTIRVSTPKQISRWVYEKTTDPKLWEIMEQEIEDDEDDNDEPKQEAATLRLTRPHIARMRGHLSLKKQRDGGLTVMDRTIDQVLELREYGGAASVAKFRKMVNQADGGRLKDSYVFNGAQQTGRFSSRGIQVHNLPRDSLGRLEESAIEDIMDMDGVHFDRHIDGFVAKYGQPGKALLRLIRPALVAPKGKVLVWADWKNIEARINPWLSMTQSGEDLLDIFADCDENPSLPDVYTRQAADVLHCEVGEVTKALRQSHGKIPVLSLGFGGSEAALLRMADAYNVPMDEDDAFDIVQRWRDANPWARHFWEQIWGAIVEAVRTPGKIFQAGRVSYLFKSDYLGGSLFCGLPNGRLLTYPQCRWEMVATTDKKTGEVTKRKQLTYRKGHGRASLWYGKACENVVQATAGSLLRAKLVQLVEDPFVAFDVVLHTHDDICVEVNENDSDDAATILQDVLTAPEDWSQGLPLAIDVTTNWYFTKAKD